MWNKIIWFFLFLFAFAVLVNAHPLGNFSINNYSRIEIEKNQIRVRCVLDMAEIPTFQESQQIDTDKNNTLSNDELGAYLEKLTPQYIANLKLFVDNQLVQIQTVAKNISLRNGSGDLSTLRIEWDFRAETFLNQKEAIQRLQFENVNYKERVGWNEIVINHAADVNVFDSSAFGSAVTDELETYPEDMLSAPLTEREAELSFSRTTIPANAKALLTRDGKTSAPVQKDEFAELIAIPEITPAIVLFGLLIAAGFGAMHAMSPGHGKTVVGAYLIGAKGTVKHAAFLGLTVTITHTLGVFALGLITLFATQFILPERLMPFLSFVSGLLVLFIGLSLFKSRLLTALGHQTDHHHHHDQEHQHDHGDNHEHHHNHDKQHGAFTHTHDGHTHSHLPPETVSWKSLLALGISGGLLPCPSALVLMLAAINLNRVGYGLLLTLAFSFGLAATLMCVGLAFLYLGKLISSPSLGNNPIVKALPVFSAFVISCVGAVICYNSLA